jgi:perosamine synthetase
MIPVFQPVISNKDIISVVRAIKNGEISGSYGDSITIFERNFAKFINTKYAAAVSNGTTALHLAVACLQLPKGSEIIISATTNIATALSVVHNNCVPVVVDSDPLTWNIDVEKIEEKITKKTKAIIVVHFLGNPVDMRRVNQVAKKRNLLVIEDAAEAHGSEFEGKKVGSLGFCGCFSLYANKVITSGEGGIIATNNKIFYEKLKLFRNLGFTKPRFKHFVSGFNFRMTGYQAAFANSQLKNIENVIKKKIEIQRYYEFCLSKVKNIQFQKVLTNCKNIYWMVGIYIKKKSLISKNILADKLKKNGVETRSFFMSMRSQPCLKIFFRKNKNLTQISNSLWMRGLYLPSSHNITKKEISRICDIIKKFIK